ncbi:LacI family DNA-binding transcriptional regulator [Promicromonospora sukumoe]|uniref:LacI family DNA-binding transcriptional regulator n=1 Tax=Promicromonospora sukumoe TaxID=88382 RepID=UPI0003793E11|nr:LacI family DNA-binding transcriptional regulator [Promicromonospora sukumoe]
MTSLVRGRPATVKDVARHAGVSASTVSNVLHGRSSVADEIRARVEAAITEVGYVPSAAGRLLRSGTSEVIQLALPDIRSPYYSALAHTVIQRARELGMTVVIEETDGAVEQEQRVASSHPHRGVGGTLICPMSLTSDDLAELRPELPTVLLGEHTRGDAFDQVFIDSRAAARDVATHLVATGRRRFAFVGTEHGKGTGPGALRLEGVRDVLRAEGLDLPDSAVLGTPDFGRETGVAVGERLPAGESGYDAVVCATDELAVGVLHALAGRGVEVPREIAVTGWDDAPESRFVTPSLTTVAHDLDDLAAAALGFVTARRADPARRPGRHVSPHRLVVRDSTQTG